MPDPPLAGAASLSFQYGEFVNKANGGQKFDSGLTCSQLKVEIAHIGDNTSVRKNELMFTIVCIRRKITFSSK